MMTTTSWQLIAIFTSNITTQTFWLMTQLVKNKQDTQDDKEVRHLFICRCLPPDMTWHMVKSHGQKAKSGDKGEGKVGNEPRLEPCWSMLLIGSLGAMWAWWGKQFHEPKSGSGHVCQVMVWTRHQGLVPYIGFEKVRGDTSTMLIPFSRSIELQSSDYTNCRFYFRVSSLSLFLLNDTQRSAEV